MYENARNQKNLFVLTIFILTRYLVFFYDIIIIYIYYIAGENSETTLYLRRVRTRKTADLVSSALKAAVDESFKLLVSVVITSLSR